MALPWDHLALLEGGKIHMEHLERGQGCCAHKTPRGGRQGRQSPRCGVDSRERRAAGSQNGSGGDDEAKQLPTPSPAPQEHFEPLP